MPRKVNSRPAHGQCAAGGRDDSRHKHSEQCNTRAQHTRLADHLSSLAAELAFRLAARAQLERTARAARLATDGLQLAEAAYHLADALALDRQVAA